ncbi:MAG: zinc-binding dehydrogenase [Faecalicatena sp.]|uniref:zinc-binding dehydrogenase n=1 Tax=Faecalicatena sp. TaxID=2005360 RepID=UPI00258DA5CF|nr:zinc-binding dehydrogenase [Faecalicatena sp.]MCI6465191.1 zinc-binding dehydrogenase [Faecalicatena sp.]MDY5621372.1 zinc-binding dehydrogenase [Lachnospiraceae bacterium]
MDLKIDDIVKQVLSEVGVPKVERTAFPLERQPVFTGNETGRTAVLASPENYEIKEFKLPEIGGKEILVQVEGCCVAPSDTAEFMKEKRIGQASLLGQQGTGVIVKLGSPPLTDAKGNSLKVGDRIVAVRKAGGSIGAFAGNRVITGVTANGWFSNYVILQAGSQVYQVNDLDLESRLLTETAIAVNSTVLRAGKLSRLDERSKVIVLGCRLEGLMAIAALRCMGVSSIIAVDGDESMLKLAKSFGAEQVIDYRDKNGMAGVIEQVRSNCGGDLADTVFQCTCSALGRSTARRFVKSSGNVCELGYVLGRGKSSAKYYEESMPVKGRFYSARDYEQCFEFLKKASEQGIPMYQLMTHRYLLEQINEAHWAAIRGEGLAIAVFNR